KRSADESAWTLFRGWPLLSQPFGLLRAFRLSQQCIPVGPEGVEPSPYRLKADCATITPQPRLPTGQAFEKMKPYHDISPPLFQTTPLSSHSKQPVGESNPRPLIESQRS